MAVLSAHSNAPAITVINGIPTTTSNEVAEYFGKRHDHVARDIRSIIEGAGGVPKIGEAALFAETTYTNHQNGETYPAYRLTRDGFTLLAMGFTGKKALAFKLAYIEAFNRMERELAAQSNKAAPQIAHTTIGSAQAQHIKELVQQVVEGTGKSYGEVWSRLHRKFCVNSYLSLSATQFDDVCKYLADKLQAQDKSSAYAALTEEEIKAFRKLVRGDCLEETLSRLTEQVTKGNGYPISMFLPLLDAINHRLAISARAMGFKA